MVEFLSPNTLRTVFPLFTQSLNKQTLIRCVTNVFYIGILRNGFSVTTVVWQANNYEASSCFQAHHLFDSLLIY
jgi:hypothetical protein